MKKIVLILCCCFLVSCSQKEVSSISSTTEITTPISQTDFSDTEAENVFNMAVRNHCKQLNQICTVGKVVLQNDMIYGTYSYHENDQEYTVTGTLENVKISNSDSSIVTIGKKLFSTGMIQTKQETNEPSDEETTKTFDLPTEVDESKNGEVVYEDEMYKIRLMHLETGAMNFNGTFDGTGYFKLYALTMDQSQRFDIVEVNESGSYNETTSLDSGWYYIVVERNEGTYTMNWQGQ